MNERVNVLGGAMEPCGMEPITGYLRNGCCDTGPDDPTSHTVCAILTDEYIAFQDANDNNLSQPEPAKQFPGLVPGNRWCVIAASWYAAYQAGKACPVVLSSTNKEALQHVPLDALLEYGIDRPSQAMRR